MLDALLLLEAEVGEFEGAGVFADGAHDLFGGTVGDVGFEFEGDGDLGSYEAIEVLDNFLCDGANVAPGSHGVEFDSAVEATVLFFGWGWWHDGAGYANG